MSDSKVNRGRGDFFFFERKVISFPFPSSPGLNKCVSIPIFNFQIFFLDRYFECENYAHTFTNFVTSPFGAYKSEFKRKLDKLKSVNVCL